MFVCPYVSSAPYLMGCENGHIVLLPTSIKCETVCAAWIDNHCVRLSNGNNTCNCKGDDVDATKTN